jgi:hypothetical protein
MTTYCQTRRGGRRNETTDSLTWNHPEKKKRSCWYALTRYCFTSNNSKSTRETTRRTARRRKATSLARRFEREKKRFVSRRISTRFYVSALLRKGLGRKRASREQLVLYDGVTDRTKAILFQGVIFAKE